MRSLGFFCFCPQHQGYRHALLHPDLPGCWGPELRSSQGTASSLLMEPSPQSRFLFLQGWEACGSHSVISAESDFELLTLLSLPSKGCEHRCVNQLLLLFGFGFTLWSWLSWNSLYRPEWFRPCGNPPTPTPECWQNTEVSTGNLRMTWIPFKGKLLQTLGKFLMLWSFHPRNDSHDDGNGDKR